MSSTIQPWLTERLGFIPPIGYDFFWFQGAPLGVGLLTSGIVLAIMILPFIAASTRDVLLTTPLILKEGGYAMGGTRWEVLIDIVLPAARASLFGAVFLGLGRALGETMAVTFVIGNANRMPDSLYAPASTIASVIANSFPEAEVGSLQLAVLLALGFLLFVVSFAVLALARVLLRQERMV
jgi:phosphate transport system permease protein